MCVVIDSAVWFALGCGNLALKAVQLGRVICAVDYVVDEELLSAPKGSDLRVHGLRVEEVGPKGVAQVAVWGPDHPRLGAADLLSLALAWEHNWRLATHDSELEELAGMVGVPVLCVVDIMEMMARTSILTLADIAIFKRAMFVRKEPYSKRKLRDVERLLKNRNI